MTNRFEHRNATQWDEPPVGAELSEPQLPFTAIVGCEALKKALLLAAVNPALGGVLIRGVQGSAKSTLARGLAALMPGASTLHTLPLSATLEQLVGTVSLEKLLQSQTKRFEPGILARAHEGIVYVDEINLLQDHLVDALLDVMASGINYVERDGISHSHAARFLLIGTMNPEEGEVRNQFLDRFGLCVDQQQATDAAFRAQVLRLSLRWQQDPQSVILEQEQAQQALKQRIIAARARLLDVRVSDAMLEAMAQLCIRAGSVGLRADIHLLAAARAHAAWLNAQAITQADIDEVSHYVLCHRRPGGADSGSAHAHDSGPSQPFISPLASPPSRSSSPSNSSAKAAEQALSNGNQASSKPFHADASTHSSEPKRAEATSRVVGAGTQGPRTRSQVQSDNILQGIPALTLKQLHRQTVVPFERLSSARPQRLAASRLDVMIQGPGIRPNYLQSLMRLGRAPRIRSELVGSPVSPMHSWIMLLDCSASVYRGQSLQLAKRLIVAWAKLARRQQQRLGVLCFGGDQVQTLKACSAAQPQLIEHQLASVSAGGGTPLSLGFGAAAVMAQGEKKRAVTTKIHLVCLTDGRSSFYGLPELKGMTVWVVDLDRSSLRLGRSASLAQIYAARYAHIDDLSA